MNTLEIFRSGRELPVIIQIDERTLYAKKLMGEHRITSEFIHNSASALDVTIGDYITYPASGENYNINQLPSVVKINNSTFKYNVAFEANLYNLNKKLFKDGANGLTDFAYNNNPQGFIDKILLNINEINDNPSWTGTAATGIDKTLQFTNESCLSALGKVAEAYKMEYDINDRVITLQKSIGVDSEISLEYGRENGLYKLSREQVSNQNIITRCYGFGGMTNIPDTYRNGNKRLNFAASGLAASGYLDSPSAQALYGIIEGVFTDDNIFPERTSHLTGVNMDFTGGSYSAVARVDKITKSASEATCLIQCNGFMATMIWNTNITLTISTFLSFHRYSFGAVTLKQISATEFTFTADVPGVDFVGVTSISEDSGTAENVIANSSGSGEWTGLNPDTSYVEDTTIDFDINACKIEKQTPTIVFKSGLMDGVECEISKFEYATKRMYLKHFTDSDGYMKPNLTHSPASGDFYTLVNISVPDSYITTAEAALQAATQEYLNENCAPHAIYNLEIDPKFMKSLE